MKNLARVISYLFHPLLIPTYGFVILFLVCPHAFTFYPIKTLKLSFIILYVLTAVVPSIMLLMMKGLEIIDSLDLQDRKQRIVPYILCIFVYLITYLTFKPWKGSLFIHVPILSNMLLGGLLAVIISFVINQFKKVSLHTVGISGIFGAILFAAPYATGKIELWLSLVILCMGAVSASRLILKAHTRTEVYLGLFVGFLGQCIAAIFS